MTQNFESDIILRLKKGDPRVMAPLFKMYHKSFYYFARQLVQNDEQAEDIVADAFVTLWEKRTDFEALASIRAYMFTIIKHKCLNYLKHIQRKNASLKEILHLAEKDENVVESKMIKANLLQIILQEVESLPPIRRKIFKMIYLEDLSVFEISQKLNISTDTVRVQKARALNGLKTMILKKGILVTASHAAGGIYFFQLLHSL